MDIQIEPGEWGEARIEDIQRLLEDVASQLMRHINAPPQGRIRVQCHPNGATPRILYRQSPDEAYVIQLTVQNRLWSRFAYQFAHELCHLLSNYEQLRLPGNQWFHESLCELASLFVLKQMAATWAISPPYQAWFSYAPNLDSYAQNCILREHDHLPAGVSLAEWFRVNEASLRFNQYQRPLNGLVAVQLLPLLQASPAHWQSIRHLPNTDESFQRFLSLWRASCPAPHKAFVTQVADTFQINLM